MEGYDATTYGERWADVYDDWYDDPGEVADIVAFVTGLAGPPAGAGRVVELGVGTGRLALPLAARGYNMFGVDASAAMVERLRAKPGGAALPVAIGDMADVPVPGRAGGVLIASNTFFGLATDESQRRCLRRVHDVLAAGGWLVISAFVPADAAHEGGRATVGVRTITADRVVLTADRYDAASQTISGQFIDITEQGIRLRPVHVRYLWPAQLDELAADAGLVLDQRWSSWTRDPFTETSGAHVSVYRRPT
jgi:SAM-dependent methyltransferase